MIYPVKTESRRMQENMDKLKDSMDDLLLELDKIQDDNTVIKKKFTESMLGTAFKNSLVFKDESIISDNIWKGDVNACFDKIVKESIDKNIGHEIGQVSYFGATSCPERRLQEHKRTFFGSDTKKGLGFHLGMDIVYYTARLEKAAQMETKLINRFHLSRNIKKVSGGLSFGKPAYFVYKLRYFLKK